MLYIKRLLIVLLSVVLLCGCSNENSNCSDYKTGNQKAVKNEQQINIQKTYSLYSITEEYPTEFDNEITGNQIDKDYFQDLENATTTQEFIDVQNKYINIWKSEMYAAVADLKSTISNTDFIEFNATQTSWEEQLNSDTQFDRSIINNSDYEIDLGSSFEWLWLSNIREQYRDRTIHIEYLLYLILNKGES